MIEFILIFHLGYLTCMMYLSDVQEICVKLIPESVGWIQGLGVTRVF